MAVETTASALIACVAVFFLLPLLNGVHHGMSAGRGRRALLVHDMIMSLGAAALCMACFYFAWGAFLKPALTAFEALLFPVLPDVGAVLIGSSLVAITYLVVASFVPAAISWFTAKFCRYWLIERHTRRVV